MAAPPSRPSYSSKSCQINVPTRPSGVRVFLLLAQPSHKSGSLVYLCAGISFLLCVKYVIITTQLLSNIYLACITIANVKSVIRRNKCNSKA